MMSRRASRRDPPTFVAAPPGPGSCASVVDCVHREAARRRGGWFAGRRLLRRLRVEPRDFWMLAAGLWDSRRPRRFTDVAACGGYPRRRCLQISRFCTTATTAWRADSPQDSPLSWRAWTCGGLPRRSTPQHSRARVATAEGPNPRLRTRLLHPNFRSPPRAHSFARHINPCPFPVLQAGRRRIAVAAFAASSYTPWTAGRFRRLARLRTFGPPASRGARVALLGAFDRRFCGLDALYPPGPRELSDVAGDSGEASRSHA